MRKEEDAEIIKYVEDAKAQNKKIVTQIFRTGYEQIKREGL